MMDVFNYDERLHSACEECDKAYGNLITIMSRLDELKQDNEYVAKQIKELERDAEIVLKQQDMAIQKIKEVQSVYN